MEYHSGGSLPLLGRPRYCSGTSANGGASGGYLCESGHCCGETGCCTYYYELWWFWLLWTVLIVFSCCCAYRHRRAKLRVQQQQRQRDIGLLAYHGAPAFTSSMLDLSFLASLKLPSYEEVAAHPSTPPPPYSSVFTAPRYPQPPPTTDPHLLTQHGALLHRQLSDGPSSLSSDNSSSCSCDSCCPSSPCSSSLSAPVTYETDTSHASTPSETTPLAQEEAVHTVSAAISRLDVANSEEPDASDPLVHQTVTVEVVTIAMLPPSPAAVTDAPSNASSVRGCSSNLDPGCGSDSGARLAAPVGSQSPDGLVSPRTLEAEPNPEGRTLLLDLCAPPTSDPSPVLEPIPSYPEGCPNLTTDPSGPEPVLWTPSPDLTSHALTPPTSDPNPELCSESGPPDGSLDLLVPSITIDPESAPSQVITPPCQHALLLDPLTALTGGSSGPAPSQSPPQTDALLAVRGRV
ncbi:mucin-2-like [Gouania willdenowi]|uniref:Mucin-2-like n=1 Tax=Gouania willdenowi TaxID=441366 RepID=A0A8C5G2X2_GOUWI|nr:mucin-2-like [Gouania willdenowi]